MDDLIAVVPYFNYFGNPHMEGNLVRVLDRLGRQGVPFLVIEAGLEHGDFFLKPAPNVVQKRSRSVIWQKERMINLALEMVVGKCQNIAWIDNDLFLPDGWDEMLLETLDRVPLVQLYEAMDYVDLDGEIEARIPGFAYVFESQKFSPLFDSDKLANPGAAWGARVDSLAGVGIYDRYVTCGSDTMMAITLAQMRLKLVEDMRNKPEEFNLLLNRMMSRHHREWEQRLVDRLVAVTGSRKPQDWVGHLPLLVDHLFHGPYRKRNYMGRHQILFENSFDPYNDLTHNDDGLLEWASDKLDLQRRIRQMFVSQSDRYNGLVA